MVDLNKYKKMFIDGAGEYIVQANESLTVLEQDSSDPEAVQDLFRSFHSIKGLAATMDYRDILELSHILEDLLDGIRNGDIELTPERLNILYEGTDTIEKMVRIIEDSSGEQIDSKPLLDRLISLSSGSPKDGQKSFFSSGLQKKTGTSLSQTDLSDLIKDDKPHYKIHISISNDSISPPARAYLILESFKEKTGVLKTIPAIDEIENGNIDREFEIYISTELNREEIEAIIRSSVEIEEFSVAEIKVAQSGRNGDEQKLLTRSPTKENEGKNLKYRKPGTVKIETHVLDSLIDIVREIFIKKNQLKDIAGSLHSDEATESVNQLEKLVQKLYHRSMTLRLVPISLLTDMLPRVSRELLLKSDKKIGIITEGTDITLDRSIVEKLGDPVIHLVRNIIDHGIETTGERIKAGKPEAGKLTFTTSREKEFINIELSDDGRGFNAESIKEKVVSSGLATWEELEKTDQAEIYNYVWQPGFSTAEKVTAVSGRGVGMGIVKSVVEGVGGRVSIKSTSEQGTVFQLQVPMTIAIIKTFRIKIDNDVYAVPLGKVVRAIEVPINELKKDDQGIHFYSREERIPVSELKSILKYSTSGLNGKKAVPVLIVDSGDHYKSGLIVDSFLATHDTVIKSLGMPLERLNIFNGYTVSEKGELILILNVDKLGSPIEFSQETC